jgi:hypothetical protein
MHPTGGNQASRECSTMNDLEGQLDALLNGGTLSGVLQALTAVCAARAREHDDAATARNWHFACLRIERVATVIDRLGI